MTIEQTKSEILTLARQKNACELGYEQAERAETYDQLLEAIKDNIWWCVRHGIATASNLTNWFGVDMLQENNIYVRDVHNLLIYEESTDIVALGNARVYITAGARTYNNIITSDSSKVSLATYENSTNMLNTFNSSFVKLTTSDSSFVNLYAYNNSMLSIREFNYSSINIEKAAETTTIRIKN